MSESISTTYEYLLAHYGPLMTLKHLAEVLHSTPTGVRMSISRKQHPMAIALEHAKRRVGRRVYFEAGRVAEAIDHDCETGEEERSSQWSYPDPIHGPKPSARQIREHNHPLSSR